MSSPALLIAFHITEVRRLSSTGERPYLCLNGGCKATFTSPYELSHHRSKCKCPTEIEGDGSDYKQTDCDSYYATTAAESEIAYAASSPAASTTTAITLAESPETYRSHSPQTSASHARGSWGVENYNKTVYQLSEPLTTIDYPLAVDRSQHRPRIDANTISWSPADFAPRAEVSSRGPSPPLPLPIYSSGWDTNSRSSRSPLPLEASTATSFFSLARSGEVYNHLPGRPADHEYDKPEAYVTRSNRAWTRSPEDPVIPLRHANPLLAYAMQRRELAPEYRLPGVLGIHNGEYPLHSVGESPLPAQLEAVKMFPGYTYPPPTRLDAERASQQTFHS